MMSWIRYSPSVLKLESGSNGQRVEKVKVWDEKTTTT